MKQTSFHIFYKKSSHCQSVKFLCFLVSSPFDFREVQGHYPIYSTGDVQFCLKFLKTSTQIVRNGVEQDSEKRKRQAEVCYPDIKC